MKSKFTIVLFILSLSAYATEQVPDILHYKSLKLSLKTGWGHPSPLETFYSQEGIDYPFIWLSTANYRGHIATWKIDDGKLFITRIDVEDNSYSPPEYKVSSTDKSMNKKDKVFADWFSGILVGDRTKNKKWKVVETYYFHVRNGQIIETAVINDSDMKRIQRVTEKDTSNIELMSKYRLLFINNNYITYYFRLNSKDTIAVEGKIGRLNRKKLGSPILQYFSNDHLKWPYNWENFEKTGAPNCKWTIRNDSVFLKEVGLLSSLSFYSVNKTIVPLSDLFSTETEETEKFADWMQGVFVIEYGTQVEDKSLTGYQEFIPSEFVYHRIKNGVITESESVESSFNFKQIPDDTPEHLKKLIEDY